MNRGLGLKTANLKVNPLKKLNDLGIGGHHPSVSFRPLSEIHDFSWSHELWGKAAETTFKVFVGLLVGFSAIGMYLLAWVDGRRGVDLWYLFLATTTTVGYGDMAPTGDVARASFIFLILFGLIVIGETENRTSLLLLLLMLFVVVVLVFDNNHNTGSNIISPVVLSPFRLWVFFCLGLRAVDGLEFARRKDRSC